MKKLGKDLKNIQQEINLNERESTKIERILSSKEAELKLSLKKGSKNTSDVVSMRKDIEKLREAFINSRTQQGIHYNL